MPATIVGEAPDVLVLLDASGSMCERLSSGGSPLRIEAMADAVALLAHRFDGRIRWGLAIFPPSGGVCAGPAIDLEPGERNGEAVGALLAPFRSDEFGGHRECPIERPAGTPTAAAVAAARSYFHAHEPNPVGQYVLLATDGLPMCGSPDPSADNTDETVAQVVTLRLDGVQTFVLGFGADAVRPAETIGLRRLAAAGGTGTYYSATSTEELDAALTEIAAAISHTTCTVALTGPTREPSLLVVRLDDGEPVPRDPSHSRGWDYDPGNNSVTFYGPPCSALLAGSVESVDVAFGCEGPLI